MTLVSGGESVPHLECAPATLVQRFGSKRGLLLKLSERFAGGSAAMFTELRRTHRSFVFPMTVAFLVWYFAYVLLADYAHGFMSIKLIGNINVGLVLGLLQFVSTFAITAAYVRFANKKLDPQAEAIRHRIEAAAGDAREGENQ